MDFNSIRLRLASPDEILSWSNGEVIKPETINYRTQRPEPEGLFSEKIFGPERDFECYCGKYRKIRYKGIICDRCGVEVTRSIVRRERFGHIKLASPVSHIWFLRGVPSRMAMILDVSLPDLEKVIYFSSYIITHVNEEAKTEAMKKIDQEFRGRLKESKNEEEKEKFKILKEKERIILKDIKKYKIISELEFRELSLKYGEVFEVGIGAEAIKKIFEEVDLGNRVKELEQSLAITENPLQVKKMTRRLKLLKGFIISSSRPEWMFLEIVPVIPPALRPMVQLDGGRYATSDLNDLYRRVINRNNRLKHLLELKAPEVITRNEKRMLQEAVDALIDNGMRKGQALTQATVGQKRSLKSLSDILKGKQGRFRQNLLGKRVDYSGRSVIVIGPELRIDECGLPKYMALELFRPFVINRLIAKGLVNNIRAAGKFIETESPEVWEALEEVIKHKLVLLNRAPTLHRLGVQAFHPRLHEGKAIRIPALPTTAFNADFDGDQMAVHLPLSEDAQAEARNLMLASRGILKPATGEPVAVPTKDIVLGCYYLTMMVDGLKGEGKIFSAKEECLNAFENDVIELQAKVKVRMAPNGSESKEEIVETTAGRIIFNEILPLDLSFINKTLNQVDLKRLEMEVLDKYGFSDKTVWFLNDLKNLGFNYATISGISWSVFDLKIPKEKEEIINTAQKLADENEMLYEQGLLTKYERRSKAIEIWTDAKSKLSEYVKKVLPLTSSVRIMVDSKARGSWSVVDQLMGMRGLFTNPAGEIIELPVKNSFKEGLTVLEYFISTHGARKGLADTALRTATAGYLTRRLVDVVQDLVVQEEDCKDKEGFVINAKDSEAISENLGKRVMGRVSLEEIKDENGKGVIKKGDLISRKQAEEVDRLKLDKLRVRNLISCKSRRGVCRICYGYDLSKNQTVELGEAVGIITAQAIGEPGTQLTMRTFHTGGVAGGGDITLGLPRVEEIFEVRLPSSKGIISDIEGKVFSIEHKDNQKVIKIEIFDTKEIREYVLPPLTSEAVAEGELVVRGQQLSEGSLDLNELFRLGEKPEVSRYIIREIKNVYFTSGEAINDKHIEMIIRQMFSRVRILDGGDSTFIPGEVLELNRVLIENDKLKEAGKNQAKYEQLLLGITKVALTTESFLSAASFQETARVLIDAATSGKVDTLRGLKENVIIGRLIPAGTGFKARTEGRPV
ncbi:MAG: DNA-directed RNA polymerase subunit beta' [Parcubacteria group bacterium RIFCSPLOWO2_01_FULL_40_65]|nr:MAG: DNA-directed RNA polymerase subunit beta' [Parcubacteria group bacterium RIFCSPHIGHO2_01_FULL_40_30]OHB18963.1 MAG: DNA-directed RNA polymerase subunit beta' [Parcubacteria group bacterium RIFCSPHIGHO2_02_FULL_40_12]OHB20947.1 MAG: DNA-directed RNA polymerase subunit beta' [Parcubacteria group bacterium RIFCSPLOWO2_01_FULL_40_65]OHB23107.1 MAG: DNA-directed RNA polymerase subunit beta' [Parcubacteria group bacterium RIFCSPLOWO2_02_FULL_40_12]OHB23827.1 MAG: DNA-directed RNA polymerase s